MNLAEVLFERGNLSDEEFLELLGTDESDEKLFFHADSRRKEIYVNDVYMRGLIEFTNYCKNNCFYCGIRNGNDKASRYRMDLDDIMQAGKNMFYMTTRFA